MSNNDADNAFFNSLPTNILRNDDESATSTSIESETFETWTLISEKQKPKTKPTTALTTTENNNEVIAHSGVEVLSANKLHNDDSTDGNNIFSNKTNTVAEIDELSDGISIISESSESIGRVSPHPLLSENLHNILPDVSLPNLLSKSNIYAGTPIIDAVDTDEDQCEAKVQETRRRKRSGSTQSTERKALQATTTIAQASVPVEEEKCLDLVTRFSEHPLTKRGLSTLFYVGVTLALLGFYGRLRNPDWDVGASKSLSELEQKINDLELQHNLMSAEIDLLSKQVNYLSNLNDKTRGADSGGKYWKQAKTFKAWPGHGNNMDAVNIDKTDLKRPYKCGEDGKFIEIGGVCVEKPPETNTETIPDEAESNIVNDVLQESETYKSFENLAEAFLNKGNEHVNEQTAEQKVKANNQEHREPYYKGYRSPPVPNSEELKSKKKYHKQQRTEHHNDSDEDDDDHDDDDDDDDDDDNSKERQKHKSNSKERYNNKYKQSKEHFDNNYKKQRKEFDSKERVDKTKDAYWHEKLMQQREQLRRQRYNHNSNNWYIERGDSREQARSS